MFLLGRIISVSHSKHGTYFQKILGPRAAATSNSLLLGRVLDEAIVAITIFLSWLLCTLGTSPPRESFGARVL